MSFRLEITDRRVCLSQLDLLNTNYCTDCQKKFSHLPIEIFEKAMSEKLIEVITDSFKKELTNLFNRECELIISNKIDLIRANVIKELCEEESKLDLYNKICGIFHKIYDDIYYDNPEVIKQPDFLLSEEDFAIAAKKDNYENYVDKGCVSYCAEFAFYKLNEEQAFPYIFRSKTESWPNAFSNVNELLKLLSRWGYKVVKKPSPGDLVLYSDNGIPKHFGIWTDDQKVLSKFGVRGVAKHERSDVVLKYGNDMFFLHNSIKSLMLKKFLKELATAHASSINFSHAVTHSPLSTFGCAKKLLKTFKDIPIVKVFENSIYNVGYNNELREEIISRIKTYSKTPLESTQKIQVIQDIQSIVISVSRETHRKI